MAREVGVEGQLGGQAKVPGAAGTWKALTENVNQLADNLTRQVRAIAEVATAVTKGDLTRSIALDAQGEMAALKDTINEMIRNLKDTTLKNNEQDWLKTNLAKFSRMLQGQRDLANVGRMVLSELCPVVSAQQAEFYVLDENDDDTTSLTLLGSYATGGEETLGKKIALGQGLVGQCALEKRKLVLDNPPPGYLRISSGLGEANPRSVMVLPLIFEGEAKGVLELASFDGFNPTHHALLEQLTESIGIVLNTIEANMRTEGLLQQSQSLAQQLQTRQQELQQTNQELQEKARLLAQQNHEVERKNSEVEQARQELEEKAKQLALTSKYKSEFLANMSHELRTPLNSLLILSDQLSNNRDGNLTSRQTEFAKTIHSSGNELLTLINDILDLSKIESGTVVVDPSEMRLGDLEGYVERTFRHVADLKGVMFRTQFNTALPESLFTDAKRLQQIIKNLLSNAFKFTQHGQVSLSTDIVTSGWSSDHESLNRAPEVVAFAVTDSGIGIPLDKQQIIFEAFQQADGSTSRKYGGTGLGLAISRELARLLGGEIRLASIPGQGSTFTLFLPVRYATAPAVRRIGSTETQTIVTSSGGSGTTLELISRSRAIDGQSPPVAVRPEPELIEARNEVGDDRDDIHPGDRVVLIVENDLGFARFLMEVAREKGMKTLVTSLGAASLTLAHEYEPDAITLDIHLLDIDGWRVLDRLKNDLLTRHIPVCVISTDESRERALVGGALAFAAKPLQSRDVLDNMFNLVLGYVERHQRSLLVVEGNQLRREAIRDSLNLEGVNVHTAENAAEARQFIQDGVVDCLVVGANSQDLLDAVTVGENPTEGLCTTLPAIVYSDREADVDGPSRFSTKAAVRQARSVNRLQDYALFFLHRRIEQLSQPQQQMISDLYQSDRSLEGKKVLIVDDDMRNIFALSTVLEEHEMVIVSADNGRDAISMLENDSTIDIVLMDIMMPEMDGMETMREIRKIPRLRNLPIVAVTAKAMKGDRERCIEAGAWDYLSKPVDPDRMLAVLRAWLHR